MTEWFSFTLENTVRKITINKATWKVNTCDALFWLAKIKTNSKISDLGLRNIFVSKPCSNKKQLFLFGFSAV